MCHYIINKSRCSQYDPRYLELEVLQANIYLHHSFCHLFIVTWALLMPLARALYFWPFPLPLLWVVRMIEVRRLCLLLQVFRTISRIKLPLISVIAHFLGGRLESPKLFFLLPSFPFLFSFFPILLYQPRFGKTFLKGVCNRYFLWTSQCQINRIR